MDSGIVIYLKFGYPKMILVKKGENAMKTKTTIAFSCPERTAQIINEYSEALGISRSACITMMCNAYIAADRSYGFSRPCPDSLKEGVSNGD